MDIKVKCEKIIYEIANTIALRNNNLSSGILGELGGTMLFFSYCDRYFGNDVFMKANKDRCVDRVLYYLADNELVDFSYAFGISGLLYSINILEKENFIEIDLSEAYEKYDPVLNRYMQIMVENSNLDFFYGAIGIGFYFLSRNDNQNYQIISSLVDILELKIIKDEDRYWYTYPLTDNKPNISLSHGMTSVAIFLSFVVKKGINKAKALRILQGLMKYILSQKVEFNENRCCYPSTFNGHTDSNKSRLAWCYGDLGIALAFWHAYQVTGVPEWKQESLRILELSASRKEFVETGIYDAPVCHGIAGVSQIFRRMYFETQETLFAETNRYWISELLKIGDNEGGFTFYNPIENKFNQCDYSLLEGLSGIGLVLLSSISHKDFSSWDNSLLLSNLFL